MRTTTFECCHTESVNRSQREITVGGHKLANAQPIASLEIPWNQVTGSKIAAEPHVVRLHAQKKKAGPSRGRSPALMSAASGETKSACAIREPLGVITGVIKLVALPAGGVRGLCERAQLGLLRLVLGLVGG